MGKNKKLLRYENPISFKETVLQFVESKGTARFTEIQEFAVDFRLGEGTYKKGKGDIASRTYNYDTNEYDVKIVKSNIHRGMYCGHMYRNDGYWANGSSRLVRTGRGVYKVVRDKK